MCANPHLCAFHVPFPCYITSTPPLLNCMGKEAPQRQDRQHLIYIRSQLYPSVLFSRISPVGSFRNPRLLGCFEIFSLAGHLHLFIVTLVWPGDAWIQASVMLDMFSSTELHLSPLLVLEVRISLGGCYTT